MSSIACRFDGSAIATMIELPVRETGMTLWRSQTSCEISFRTSSSMSYSSRLIDWTRYCWLRKSVISESEMKPSRASW
jgi:hypothetical protein